MKPWYGIHVANFVFFSWGYLGFVGVGQRGIYSVMYLGIIG